MTATDRAAAVISRLIADNLIAAPFEDYPDATYYASIVAMVAAAIREAEAVMRGIDPKWLAVAGALFIRASQEFSNHGSNDWEWPADWTPEERFAFATAMVSDNVQRPPSEFTALDREDADHLARGKYGPPDWWVMLFLGKRLTALS
jgi:hypothetical protein